MSDPFINCVFEAKNNIFINLYDPRTKILTYFSYNAFQGKLKWNPVQLHLQHKGVNYPIKNVYDSTRNLYFIFFRHGQSIIINPAVPKMAKQQQLMQECVHNIFFVRNQVLIVVCTD